MRHERIIARIKDMIAELRADPRKEFSRDELRDVLGSERMIECAVKVRKARTKESAAIRATGYEYWGQNEPGLWYYRELRETGIRETRAIMSHIETALRNKRTMTPAQWEKPNAGGSSLAMRMKSWEKQLVSWPASVKRVYDGLSEREKLFLTAPAPNATRCDQMPAPCVAANGFFYPELPAHSREQIAALEAELTRLEQEVESGT